MKLNKWTIPLIICLILSLTSVAFVFSSDKEEQKNYIEEIINNFPIPEDNEFDTPESVINVYIDSIKENDIDQTFKCLPIKEYYDARNLENYTKYMKAYTYIDGPVPELYFHNYLKAMEPFERSWSKLVYLALFYEEGDTFGVTNEDSPRTIKVDPNTIEGAKKLEELTTSIDVEKIKQSIGEIKISKGLSKKINLIHQAMGVTEEKLVVTTINIRKKFNLELEFDVGKIGSNWRIIDITYPY
jgi:hypothetical protein